MRFSQYAALKLLLLAWKRLRIKNNKKAVPIKLKDGYSLGGIEPYRSLKFLW